MNIFGIMNIFVQSLKTTQASYGKHNTINSRGLSIIVLHLGKLYAVSQYGCFKPRFLELCLALILISAKQHMNSEVKVKRS